MADQLPVAVRAQQALATVTTEEQLRALAIKHADLTTVKNRTDFALAMSALSEFRTVRVAIEKAGKAAREDATQFQRAVIAEEKRLIGIIVPEENRVRMLRENYEAEQERIRQELARKEAERIAAIRERIAGFQSLVLLATGTPSAEVAETVVRLESIQIDDTFQELRREAEIAHTAALDSARKLLVNTQAREKAAAEARAKAEAEAEQRRKEAEELERLRADQARQSEELARQQAEIERQQQEAEAKLAAERAEIERQQQEAEAKLAAERAEIERQKQEIEARQHAEEEAKAKAQAEAEAQVKTETEARALAEKKAAEVKVSKSEPEPDPVPKPSLADELGEWRKRYKITKTAFDALMAILAHH